MRRTLRILSHSLLAATRAAAAYRVNFALNAGMSAFWLVWNVATLVLFFRHREAVAGWSFHEALVVMAFFTALKGLLDGVVHPNLSAIVEHVRTGTLDFILLKPASPKILTLFASVSVWRVVDLVGAAGLVVWACVALERAPSAGELAAALALLVCATLTLYAVFLIVVSLAFWVVRVDNLSYLFIALFDAARWPVSIFQGPARILVTFVVPLGIMTSYPAMALLGRLDARHAAEAVAVTAVFLGAATALWSIAIRKYTSAGG